MGTRLLSEQLIKNRFPHIRYVRIHTDGRNKATIYAWNDDLQLLDQDKLSLKQFANSYLLACVCFNVKAYNMVRNDKVPQVQELPKQIIKTALSRNLNQYGIAATINRLFPCGHLIFDRYDAITGCVHFDYRTTSPINDNDKKLIADCLYEIMPLGSTFEVTYY